MRLGSPTLFNMVWELQQIASWLAYSQVKDPKVSVDPKYAWISIGKQRLHLDRLRSGMQTLIQTAKDSYMSLSGDDVWPGAPADLIIDDVGNTGRGYCFLDEQPFKATKYSFFFSLVERLKLGAFITEGEWSWDRNAVRRFLDRADKLWGHVIHALFVGSQLSTRVTQFLQHQIRNADRPRNLLFQGKEAMLIGRYSKTTNSKGKDGCTPAFLAAPLADLLLVLLGGGFREAQAILAGIEHGESSRWVYRT